MFGGGPRRVRIYANTSFKCKSVVSVPHMTTGSILFDRPRLHLGRAGSGRQTHTRTHTLRHKLHAFTWNIHYTVHGGVTSAPKCSDLRPKFECNKYQRTSHFRYKFPIRPAASTAHTHEHQHARVVHFTDTDTRTPAPSPQPPSATIRLHKYLGQTAIPIMGCNLPNRIHTNLHSNVNHSFSSPAAPPPKSGRRARIGTVCTCAQCVSVSLLGTVHPTKYGRKKPPIFLPRCPRNTIKIDKLMCPHACQSECVCV